MKWLERFDDQIVEVVLKLLSYIMLGAAMFLLCIVVVLTIHLLRLTLTLSCW